jgi:hypothetical protein
MKKFSLILLVALALSAIQNCEKTENPSPLGSQKYETLRVNMLQLWSDHGAWTRNVIFNLVDGAQGTTQDIARLLKNQDDIGNAIKTYYGDAAGDALTALLKTHINTAAAVVIDAKSGNTTALATDAAALYANGDDIAVFLNTANPDNWKLTDWKAMMKMHLDLTVKEATDRLQGNYDADIEDFDAIMDDVG